MYVILIKSDGTYSDVEIDGSLKSYQSLVNGYIETVRTKVSELLLLIDEEGKLKHLPINRTASQMMHDAYCDWFGNKDTVSGNAVLVRFNRAHDDWTGWDDRNEAILNYTILNKAK